MKKANWLYILMVGLAVVACKKELIDEFPYGDDPIYGLTGLIDGGAVNLNVGYNNIRMNHGTSKENGMLTYFGEIESVLEDQKIRIEIVQQEKPRKGTEYNLFETNNVPFLVHQKGVLVFDFGGVGNQTDYLMLEDVNGNFVNAKEIQIDEYGIAEVNARISDYNNTTFKFELKHGYREVELVSKYFSYGLGKDSIHVESIGVGTFHEWFLDGILVGGGNEYNGPITSGIHTIAHRIIDEDGNSSISKGLVRFKGGKQFWTMETFYREEGPSFKAVNYGAVMISVYQGGKWYHSEHVEDNLDNVFNIKDILFVPNYEGERPLMAFDTEFSATLLSEDGTETIELTNMSGRYLVGLQ